MEPETDTPHELLLMAETVGAAGLAKVPPVEGKGRSAGRGLMPVKD